MKLRTLIEQYLGLQKSVGKKFHSAGQSLRAFSSLVGAKANVEEVTTEHVLVFLNGAGPITSTYYAKYTVLRGFYRYAKTRGYVEQVPLPIKLPKPPRRVPPYIYSREEIQRLLASTDVLDDNRCSLDPFTLRIILLLLYGSGLRVNEALALNDADVDLQTSVITVRASKFYKSRFVPVGLDLSKALSDYATKRTTLPQTPIVEAPFFTTRSGGRVKYPTVLYRFRLARDRAGIRRSTKERFEPRLHDLRHTFAVHRMVSWYRQGADVSTLLPHLSVYLGHVSLAATQIYLSMTPELLQEASTCFQRYAFPETSHD